MKRIKGNIPTIVSIIVFLLPIIVFAVNIHTLQDVIIMNSLTGKSLLYSALGMLMIFTLYLAYRVVYTPKNQKPYVLVSLISVITYILYMTLFTICLIGLITGVLSTTISSTGGLVIVVVTISMVLLFLDCDWKFYNTKKNTPVIEAFKDSTKRSSSIVGIFSIIVVLTTFAASIIINDWTPFLMTIAILTVWNGIFYVLTRPHLIGRIISWKYDQT